MHSIVVRPSFKDRSCRKILSLLLRQQTKSVMPAMYYGSIFLTALFFLILFPFLFGIFRKSLSRGGLLRMSLTDSIFLFVVFGMLVLLWYSTHVSPCRQYCRQMERTFHGVSFSYTLDASGLLLFSRVDSSGKEQTAFYRHCDSRKIWIKKYGILLCFQPPSGPEIFFALPSVWFMKEEYESLTLCLKDAKGKS